MEAKSLLRRLLVFSRETLKNRNPLPITFVGSSSSYWLLQPISTKFLIMQSGEGLMMP